MQICDLSYSWSDCLSLKLSSLFSLDNEQYVHLLSWTVKKKKLNRSIFLVQIFYIILYADDNN